VRALRKAIHARAAMRGLAKLRGAPEVNAGRGPGTGIDR